MTRFIFELIGEFIFHGLIDGIGELLKWLCAPRDKETGSE